MALASFLVTSLAGCGGGGSGQSTGTEAQAAGVFDVQAAVSAMFQTVASYELTGSLSALQTGGSAIEFRETDAFMPGAPADPLIGDTLTTVLTRTTSSSTATTPRSETETYHYTANPFRLVARKSGNSFVVRYTRSADLPAQALVGQSGLFANGTEDGSTQLHLLNWKVEASGIPGTAWVCLDFIQIRTRFSQCVRVTASGTILGGRHVIDTSGLGGPVIDLR
jgi:hypothetical protein